MKSMDRFLHTSELKSFGDMKKRHKVSVLVRLACLVFLIILFVIVWNL